MTTTMTATMPSPASLPTLRSPRRIAVAGVLAFALLGAAAGLAAPVHAGKDPEFPVTPNLTRKINEYEGQHRLTVAGDRSQWGVATGKDQEIPVTPNLTRKVNEYEGQHRLSVAGGKDPEYPTTPG
jgi:hypothetical protein